MRGWVSEKGLPPSLRSVGHWCRVIVISGHPGGYGRRKPITRSGGHGQGSRRAKRGRKTPPRHKDEEAGHRRQHGARHAPRTRRTGADGSDRQGELGTPEPRVRGYGCLPVQLYVCMSVCLYGCTRDRRTPSPDVTNHTPLKVGTNFGAAYTGYQYRRGETTLSFSEVRSDAETGNTAPGTQDTSHRKGLLHHER